MTLSEPLAVFVAEQLTVKPCRIGVTERAVQQHLPRRGFEQVGATHHLGDLHRGIINDDSQLIGGNVIATPYQEVTKVFAGNECLRAEIAVYKSNHFAHGHTKAPVHARRCHQFTDRSSGRPAGTGIERPVVAFRGVIMSSRFMRRMVMACICRQVFMRSTSGLRQFAPGAVTGINPAAGTQTFPGGSIEMVPLALRVGTKSSAIHLLLPRGAFLPLDS